MEGWFDTTLDGQRGWLAYRDGQCAAEGYAAHGGTTYVGTASAGVESQTLPIRPANGSVAWRAYADEFNTLTDVLSTYRVAYDFPTDAKAVSTLPDGTYCTISTNVESDVDMFLTVQCNQGFVGGGPGRCRG